MLIYIYKDEILSGEIQHLNKMRKELADKLKALDEQLLKKQLQYNKNKDLFYFKKGICGSCQYKLSEEDLKYKMKYCDECRENDSVLAWNCRLSE